MAKGLDGRVIAMTGAASGIGAATADLLREGGARVARLDIGWPAKPDKGNGTSESELTLALDVTDERCVGQAFARIAQHFGRLDGLATCAGIVDTSAFEALDGATFRRVLDVNLVGTFLCMQAAAGHLVEGGRIVTIASVAGIRGGGLFGTAAYAASKGGVLALTKNAARVLGPRGITVNCIAPGSVDTPMTAPIQADPDRRERLKSLVALGRSAVPSEIGEAIAWLMSPRASYVSGATLVVDGGLVMM
jgi:NAD(P)-dependent dehydrogenase (short-subunit alcohol dehydrogenase family)